MRFHRSLRRHPDWAALFQRHDVSGFPGIESEAFQTPTYLKKRIIAGHSPLGIWVSREEQSLYDPQIAEKFDLSYAEFNREISRSDGEFMALSGEDVLDYCESIGVHPAHLVPFDNDPRLSLPVNIFQANLIILENEAYDREEKKLAEAALKYEMKRYDRFLNDRRFQKDNKVEGVSKLLNRALKHQFEKKVDVSLLRAEKMGGFFLSNQAGVFNRAALMLDMFVSRKDKYHDSVLHAFKQSAEAVRHTDKKIYDMYEGIFSDLEYDTTSGADLLFQNILAELKVLPSDFESLDVRGVARTIKLLKSKEIRLMEQAIVQLPLSEQMPISLADRQFMRLAELYLDKMKAIQHRNAADVDMKEDEWDYEDMIADYHEAIAKISHRDFSYIGRLFANHKLMTVSGDAGQSDKNDAAVRESDLSL